MLTHVMHLVMTSIVLFPPLSILFYFAFSPTLFCSYLIWRISTQLDFVIRTHTYKAPCCIVCFFVCSCIEWTKHINILSCDFLHTVTCTLRGCLSICEIRLHVAAWYGLFHQAIFTVRTKQRSSHFVKLYSNVTPTIASKYQTFSSLQALYD